MDYTNNYNRFRLPNISRARRQTHKNVKMTDRRYLIFATQYQFTKKSQALTLTSCKFATIGNVDDLTTFFFLKKKKEKKKKKDEKGAHNCKR